MDTNNISSEVDKIVLEAVNIYYWLEKQDIIISLYARGSSFFSSSVRNIKINKIDKQCLSLLLASLKVECGAKRVIDDFFDITFTHVLDTLNIPLYEDRCFDFSDDMKYYYEIFQPMINKMAKRVVYLSSESLVELLYSSEICGSQVVDVLLKEVGEKYAPLSFENLESFLSNRASEKAMKYLDDHPDVKSKYADDKKRFINDVSSLFGFATVQNKKNTLDEYGVYLTEQKFEENPVIGRKEEIKKLEISLLTPEESPILLGEAGVGKTAIVEGLAYLIQKGEVPEGLRNKKILMINTAELVSGCKYVGMFEERMEEILSALQKDKETILFIDELHTALGAGAGSNSNLDLINILKPYLGRGKIKMIGATTADEYNKYVVLDSAFKRRFSRVDIKEPNKEVLISIMDGSIPKYEKAVEVEFLFSFEEKNKIFQGIIDATQDKNRIYNDKGVNPDLALAILKKSFSYAKYNSHTEVTLEDITDSIMSCERIYESVREKIVASLNSTFNSLQKPKEKTKVVEFSQYRK